MNTDTKKNARFMCESTGHQMLILVLVQGSFSNFLWILYIHILKILCTEYIIKKYKTQAIVSGLSWSAL